MRQILHDLHLSYAQKLGDAGLTDPQINGLQFWKDEIRRSLSSNLLVHYRNAGKISSRQNNPLEGILYAMKVYSHEMIGKDGFDQTVKLPYLLLEELFDLVIAPRIKVVEAEAIQYTDEIFMSDLMETPVCRRNRINNLTDVLIDSWVEIISNHGSGSSPSSFFTSNRKVLEKAIQKHAYSIMPEEMDAHILRFMELGGHRDVSLIRQRYGLNDGERNTLPQVGELNHVSKQAVGPPIQEEMENLRQKKVQRDLLLFSWYVLLDKETFLAQEGARERTVQINEMSREGLRERGLSSLAIENIQTSLLELMPYF